MGSSVDCAAIERFGFRRAASGDICGGSRLAQGNCNPLSRASTRPSYDCYQIHIASLVPWTNVDSASRQLRAFDTNRGRSNRRPICLPDEKRIDAVVKWQELTKMCDTHPKVTMKKAQQPPEPCSTAKLEEAIKVLEGRWKILIIFHLFSAPVLRFSELRRAIIGISQKMLIQQPRRLFPDRVVAESTSSER